MTAVPTSLQTLLDRQDGVCTREQVLESGISASGLLRRLKSGWQQPVRGILAPFTGELSVRQLQRSALLYGDVAARERERKAAIGAAWACRIHEIPYVKADPTRIVVVVPHECQACDDGFVTLRRSTIDEPAWVIDGLRVCSPARAVVDACRSLRGIREVRAVIAAAVQVGKATVPLLEAALATGESAGSLLTRRVLAEVGDGIRSAPEAELRDIVRKALPGALYNATLFDGAGRELARPDAYWPDAALIAEVDSREWHISPAAWAATIERAGRLRAIGFEVAHYVPNRLRSEPAVVLAELTALHERGCPKVQAGLGPDGITVALAQDPGDDPVGKPAA
jgi:hypothetical protein